MNAVEVTVSGRVGPLLREAISGTPVADLRLVTVLRVTAADTAALWRLLGRLDQADHAARTVRFHRHSRTRRIPPDAGDDSSSADSRG
ncbi:hypothetical protein HDA40_002515 [Hamadaea flava]|uniref:Uncharacterized protein n=1 Tax=Hamadaea flava TaxID=1742688 RepID=A0ABV8LKP3_9ACTN|nr:hypothetical protein [Hamadaea flava]MCP2324008.1 hypothetical protein [Hamadaea flava]